MVIISNFYNESYMLPWWLKHNKIYFEHGVLFDYHSTDDSAKIIKKICPTWEIRTTKTKAWDPLEEDNEMMEAEKEFGGYKMILTMTEFLVGNPKLREELTCFKIPTKRMVDVTTEYPPVYKHPLMEQKPDGYMAKINKYRYLHNYPDGGYEGAGRHKTRHKRTPCDLVVWKYAYCPWTEEFIQRRLQFKKNMSKAHLEGNWGKQHKLDKKELQTQYEKEVAKL